MTQQPAVVLVVRLCSVETTSSVTRPTSPLGTARSRYSCSGTARRAACWRVPSRKSSGTATRTQKRRCTSIDVIRERAFSLRVAGDLQIGHASPQVIVVRDGQAAWSESHWRIDADTIADAVSRAAA